MSRFFATLPPSRFPNCLCGIDVLIESQERKLRDFLQTLHGVADRSRAVQGGKWRAEEEGRLQQVLLQAQSGIQSALADDFDTPKSLQELSSLISATNVYMLRPAPSHHLLLTVVAYTEWLLRTFGLSKLLSEETIGASSTHRNAVNALGMFFVVSYYCSPSQPRFVLRSERMPSHLAFPRS
jgi:cysteinyl-tRNA synthetase